MLDSGEAEPLREKLWANVARLDPSAPSAIVPHLVGGEAAAMALSAGLLAAGLLVPAIRYPTVGRGQARLRIGLSAAHSAAQVDRLAAALSAPERGL